jgi:hypothetical protein
VVILVINIQPAGPSAGCTIYISVKRNLFDSDVLSARGGGSLRRSEIADDVPFRPKNNGQSVRVIVTAAAKLLSIETVPDDLLPKPKPLFSEPYEDPRKV